MKSSAHQVTLRELMPLCSRQDLVIVFQYNPFFKANLNIRHNDAQGHAEVLRLFGDRKVIKQFGFDINSLAIHISD